MPVVKRNVETDVSNDQLVAELQEYAKQVNAGGVFYANADNTPSKDPIEVGDILQPKPELYDQYSIAKDTLLLVTGVVPQTGIFLTAFHNRDGTPTQGFFTPAHVLGRHDDLTPKRAPSKPRKRGGAR